MAKKLAIKGHATRGKEVIELLKMMGGKNIYNLTGTKEIWYILSNTTIEHSEYLFDEKGFTLEEFLEKYPFKVGDVIKFPNNMLEEIAEMKWDENSEDILCTSTSGCTRLLRAHLENPKSNKQKETIMRYKVGNKVKIKSIDWYNANKDKIGVVRLTLSSNSTYNFVEPMATLCGEVVTIGYVDEHRNFYRILEDVEEYYWTDEMIEGLVEEKFITTNGLQFKQLNISLENEMEWNLPQGYQFKDENGNIIKATKIVLEKVKKEYPKTYEECCKIIHSDPKFYVDTHLYSGILGTLYKLLICRNAYWKIAGEDMGLGKPWEPDFDNDNEYKYGIFRLRNIIYKDATCINPRLLVFPTIEMQDAFYENFKKEIEQCKELL